jgi:phosphoribosylformylglycinamidine synthase subunit PurS
VTNLYEAVVEVQLRPGIADPQGVTIERALPALGFSGVSGVRTGKAFRLRVEAAGEAEAQRVVEDLCSRLLANPVIESSTIALSPWMEAAPVEVPAGPAGEA